MRRKIEKSSKKNIIDILLLASILGMFISYFGHSYWRTAYYFFDGAAFVFALLRLVKVKKIPGKPYLLWYVSFFALCLFSMLWTISENYSFNGVKNVLLIVMAIFSICMYASNRQKIKHLMIVYIIACLYMCFRLLLFETAVAQVTNDYGQVVGLYFNEVAISLAFGITFCFYLAMTSAKRSVAKFIMLFLASALFYWIILITGSRKAILLPIIFVIVYIAISSVGHFRIKEKRGKRIAKVVFLITTLGLLAGVLATNTTLTSRLQDLGESFFGTKTEDVSINEREFYREEAMSIFSEKPVLGNGINAFTAHIEDIGYWHVAYSHCNYTEILSCLGLVGFVVYYYGYFYVIKKCIKKKTKISLAERCFVLTMFGVVFLFEYGMVTYYIFPVQMALAIPAQYLFLEAKEKKEQDSEQH